MEQINQVHEADYEEAVRFFEKIKEKVGLDYYLTHEDMIIWKTMKVVIEELEKGIPVSRTLSREFMEEAILSYCKINDAINQVYAIRGWM